MTALRSAFDARPMQPKDFRPHHISGAEWQAGVTDHNELYRILLNGEPVPLAFAANETRGWVMVFGDPEKIDGAYRIPRNMLGLNPATGDNTSYRTLTGYVQIVRGDREFRS